MNFVAWKFKPNPSQNILASLKYFIWVRFKFLACTSTNCVPFSWSVQYYSNQGEGNFKPRLMKVIGVGFPFSWNEALGSPFLDQSPRNLIKNEVTSNSAFWGLVGWGSLFLEMKHWVPLSLIRPVLLRSRRREHKINSQKRGCLRSLGGHWDRLTYSWSKMEAHCSCKRLLEVILN